MKKIVSMIVLFMASVILFAQQDVTQFLGIPVDGTKSEMIEKLKAKGFQYNSTSGLLKGEFNGSPVYLSVVTNKNKVWRIMVKDAVPLSESRIKARYNKLCNQFINNKRYTAPNNDYYLSEKEDISEQILLYDKQYQAVFFQNPTDSTAFTKYTQEKTLLEYTEEEFNSLTEEEKKSFSSDVLLEYISNKMVWFTLCEDKREYGKYIIIMFYDNEYNHANGEDL